MAKKAAKATASLTAAVTTKKATTPGVEDGAISSKFRISVSNLRKMLKLLSMEGSDNADSSGKKSKSLFKEVIGLVSDKKFEAWAMNESGSVFCYLRHKVEDIQKGEFWCGDMSRFLQLGRRLGSDSSQCVVSCGNRVQAKMEGVLAYMANVAKDQIGRREDIEDYKDMLTDDIPPTFGRETETSHVSVPTVEVIAEVSELGEIVKDADIMHSEDTIYPFLVREDGKDEQGKDKYVFEVTSNDKSDGVVRSFISATVPIGQNVQSVYKTGIANVLRALSGMGKIKMFFSADGVLFLIVNTFSTKKAPDPENAGKTIDVDEEEMHFLVLISPRVDNENLEAGGSTNLSQEQAATEPATEPDQPEEEVESEEEPEGAGEDE